MGFFVCLRFHTVVAVVSSKTKKEGTMVKLGRIVDIIIGCDHAAFTLKEALKSFLIKRCKNVADAGTYSEISVDYPDVGFSVASKVSNGTFGLGVLICGTGVGMSMVANRFPHVRAALCNDILTARMSKKHNNSNILVMGSRIVNTSLAADITKVWLETNFENGRHQRRLDKFDSLNDILTLITKAE